MNNTLSISCKKPAIFHKRKFKVDYKKILPSTIKSITDLTIGNYPAFIKSVSDFFVGIDCCDNIEAMGWILVQKTLTRTVLEISAEYNINKTCKSDVTKNILSWIDTIQDEHAITITQSFILHSDSNSDIKCIAAKLTEQLKKNSSPDAEAISIGHKFPFYFTYNLEKEWASNPSKYEEIHKYLFSITSIRVSQIDSWAAYRSYLKKKIHEPLFNESFSLNDIFVPLRAYYKTQRESEIQGSDYDHLSDNRRGKPYTAWLDNLVKEWLAIESGDDHLRVISGGPGSGKSSYGKILAAELATLGKNVLFIPLHLLDIQNDIPTAIGHYLSNGSLLSHNPLVTCEDNITYLILDGLDELSMQGRTGLESAKNLVDKLQLMIRQFNVRKCTLKAIVTGRELAVQSGEVYLSANHILYLLPYYMDRHNPAAYQDPFDIMKIDQRLEWWSNYAKATGKDETNIPTPFTNRNYDDLTAQPLLNYLVILSYERGTLDFDKNPSLSQIYTDLLEAVYQRDWESQQHSCIRGIEKKEFMRILEEIGLAIWYGGGRTASLGEIYNLCKKSGIDKILTRFTDGAEDGLSRLLTAFYFRKSNSNRDDACFEFTHKSFGEYLIARRINRFLQKMNSELENHDKDIDSGWQEQDALKQSTDFFCFSQLDSYIVNFLRSELTEFNLAKIKKNTGKHQQATFLIFKKWTHNN